MEKIILRVSDVLNNINLGENLGKIPSKFLIILILSISYLSFIPSPNEEQYMQRAMQFFNPNWILNSRNLTEFPGTRVLYQYIIGFLLQYFSFENLTFIFRFIFVILYTIPLNKIYEKLNFTNFQILLHLPILFLLNQSLFAQSWIFISIEPKGFSYIFIFFSLYYYMTKSFTKMTFFLILGTYFHVLIGGYSFIYFMLSLFILKKNKESLFNLIRLSFIYLILIAPLLIYLKSSIIISTQNEPSADWIYTYFRSPHHTALFKSFNYFYKTHFYGVLLSIIGVIFCIKNHSQINSSKIKSLNTLVIVSLCATLAFVPIAFFDKTGIILKYYPFRINTLSTFILTLLISKWIFDIVKFENYRNINHYILLFSFFFILKIGGLNITNQINFFIEKKDNPLKKVCQYIYKNTKKKDIIFSFDGDITIPRKCRRDVFSTPLFIPSEMKRIHDWYQRVLIKRKLTKNIDSINEVKKQYRINYILSKKSLEGKNYLDEVYSNKEYFLYKIISP